MSLLPVYDKYAPYVWSAYGLTALILIGLALWLALEARRAARTLAELEAKQARKTSPASAAPGPSASAARLREAP
ncbi:heme exporter protein CcmD [Neomegalonema sp.]|uniref:heme exporter protein CcmD n=1 Tax=Neomegalonema sp. TaxID=2039713 RepID=UPI00260FA838|nr:heme exporter protein CcmD [Neomegalonema sp.]MDD2869852.1 heme exporter protein CcmD [Neomegalonema sp.]